MNKKVLVIATALMAVAMLALPMSAVSAAKPEKFVSITIYGYPNVFFGGKMHYDTYMAGDSDNLFMIWYDTDWCFCEDYTPKATPPYFTPLGTFAAGHYDGKWILHGYDAGPPPTHTTETIHGTYSMEITMWDGAPATGNLVIVGNGNSKMNIVSGTINGQLVHGGGTSSPVLQMRLYKYEFTIHFEP